MNRSTIKKLILISASILIILIVALSLSNLEKIKFRYYLWKSRGDNLGDTFSNFSRYDELFSFEVKKDFYKKALMEYKIYHNADDLNVFFDFYFPADILSEKEKKTVLREMEKSLLYGPNDVLGWDPGVEDYTYEVFYSLSLDSAETLKYLFNGNDTEIYRYIDDRMNHYKHCENKLLQKWGVTYYKLVREEYTNRYSAQTREKRLAKMKGFYLGRWIPAEESSTEEQRVIELELTEDNTFVMELFGIKGRGKYHIEDLTETEKGRVNIALMFSNGRTLKCIMKYFTETLVLFMISDNNSSSEFQEQDSTFLEKVE